MLARTSDGTQLWSQTCDRFDNIRQDPRWLPFLRKIGRSPEDVAKIEFKVTLPE